MAIDCDIKRRLNNAHIIATLIVGWALSSTIVETDFLNFAHLFNNQQFPNQ